MIICPDCGNPLSASHLPCSNCGFLAARQDGFVVWAPALAAHNDGFRAEFFAGLAEVEAQHFWFRARNSLIVWALDKYFPGFDNLLEVGCGSGYVLSGMSRAFPHARFTGSEIFVAGLSIATGRAPGAELVQMDARKLPYADEFDVVAAFDVIEHIEEDEIVLRNFYAAVKPGGGCVITVPQHMWMWSPVDEEACHKRRYNARELRSKVEAAGFEVVRSTSFVTALLPAMFASRLLIRRSGTSGGVDSLRMNPVINWVFGAALAVERFIIKAGINLPIGGSRLIIARRPAAPAENSHD